MEREALAGRGAHGKRVDAAGDAVEHVDGGRAAAHAAGQHERLARAERADARHDRREHRLRRLRLGALRDGRHRLARRQAGAERLVHRGRGRLHGRRLARERLELRRDQRHRVEHLAGGRSGVVLGERRAQHLLAEGRVEPDRIRAVPQATQLGHPVGHVRLGLLLEVGGLVDGVVNGSLCFRDCLRRGDRCRRRIKQVANYRHLCFDRVALTALITVR